MRVQHVFAATFIAALVLFSGCGKSSIESDAKRLADIQCRAMKLAQKSAAGDMSTLSESLKLSADATELSLELQKRYTGEDAQTFSREYLKALGQCK